MTSTELIEVLKIFKPDSKVVIADENGEEYEITEILHNALDEVVICFEKS